MEQRRRGRDLRADGSGELASPSRPAEVAIWALAGAGVAEDGLAVHRQAADLDGEMPGQVVLNRLLRAQVNPTDGVDDVGEGGEVGSTLLSTAIPVAPSTLCEQR